LSAIVITVAVWRKKEFERRKSERLDVLLR
jgi:hypothetical protein